MQRRHRKGASAVEFALTLPFVIALVAITVEWGWVLSQQAWVHAAARDACRFSVELDPLDVDISAQAALSAQEWMTAYDFACDSGDCDIQAEVKTVGGRDALTVDIDVIYRPIFGLIPVPESLHGESTHLLKYQ
tara:strand:+ start:193 stop:594 length:402 start_codon:yes stop_codon:yes gene_type:complete